MEHWFGLAGWPCGLLNLTNQGKTTNREDSLAHESEVNKQRAKATEQSGREVLQSGGVGGCRLPAARKAGPAEPGPPTAGAAAALFSPSFSL